MTYVARIVCPWFTSKGFINCPPRRRSEHQQSGEQVIVFIFCKLQMCEDDKVLSYVFDRNSRNGLERLTQYSQACISAGLSFHKCDKVATTGTCRLAFIRSTMLSQHGVRKLQVTAQLLYGSLCNWSFILRRTIQFVDRLKSPCPYPINKHGHRFRSDSFKRLLEQT